MNSKNEKIRGEIKRVRDLMNPEDSVALSEVITQRIISLDVIKEKMNFLVYKSFKNEVGTAKLIEYLEDCGKTLAFPIVIGDDMVAGISKSNDFAPDSFGIETPLDYKIMEEPEVVFVPLIACDKNKNRLGFGKGYFDRYLNGKHAIKIGLCYDFQVVEHIDKREWDIPLDIIITESKIIK